MQALRQIRSARETCARILPGLHAGGNRASRPDLARPEPFRGRSRLATRRRGTCTTAKITRPTCTPGSNLARRGVRAAFELRPERPGEITPALVESALTPSTRLVALASAFLPDWLPHRRGRHRPDARFARRACFRSTPSRRSGRCRCPWNTSISSPPTRTNGCSGRSSAGIVFVKTKRTSRGCVPILLGAANVRSPDLVAQSEIVFPDTAARYEPGVLNLGPILGMKASLDLILERGTGDRSPCTDFARHVKRLADGAGCGLGFEPAGTGGRPERLRAS